MMKEAKKANVDRPQPRKATAVEEARKRTTEQVASVYNVTMEGYCEDYDSIKTTED